MVRTHALTFALLCTVAAPALAFETKHDSTGATVRWPGAVTFVVQPGIAEALDEPQAKEAIDAALAEVTRAAPALVLRATDGQTHGAGYDLAVGASNQSEIVVDEEWADYDPNAIAVTLVTVDTKRHEILDADVVFNLASRRFKVLPPTSKAGGAYDDIQNTLTHELGHAVGLAHNPDLPDSVMYPGARRGEVNKRVLNDDDRAGLAELYPGGAPAGASGDSSAGGDAQGAAGCSASARGSSGWVLAALAALIVAAGSRRRRAALRTSAADVREAFRTDGDHAPAVAQRPYRSMRPEGTGTPDLAVAQRAYRSMRPDGNHSPSIALAQRAYRSMRPDGAFTPDVAVAQRAYRAMRPDGNHSPFIALAQRAYRSMRPDGNRSPVIALAQRAYRSALALPLIAALFAPVAAVAQTQATPSPNDTLTSARDPLSRAEVVLTGEIVSAHTLAPQPNARLLWTELEVRVRECVKGACPASTWIRVPGGRLGDLEQVVEDHEVPQPGEVVALAIAPSAPESKRAPRPAVFRLSDTRDLVRFAQALEAAHLNARVPAAVSGPTSRSNRTQQP